jgi:transcriptional regulator with XRE-family HTH domain
LQSKIYEFRKRKHWTLMKLSRLSRIPLNTVLRMEKGYGVTLKNAYRIAQLFGVTVYDLWSIAPAGTPVGTVIERVASLRSLRRSRHWGLAKLAKLSGVSKTTLSITESGHTPTLENAASIAAALGVSVYHIWKPKPLRTRKKIQNAKEARQKAIEIKNNRPKLFL